MRFKLCIWLAGLTLLSQAAMCDDLDTIEANIKKAWANVSSASYDMESTTIMSNPQFSMNSTSTGTSEMVKKGEKWLLRMDGKTTGTQKVAGNETKTDSTQLVVCDGDYIYSMSDAGGQKMCSKMKADDWSKMVDTQSMFKWLKETHNLKVLADENVDGQACYVVEATPKENGANAMAMKYFFSKDHGIVLQTTAKSPDGSTNSSMKIKNLKLNPSIASDRFTFTPPPGVQVQDMDALKQQAEAAQKQSQKQESAPAKKEEASPAKTETAENKSEPKEEKKDDKKKESTGSKAKKKFGL